eukprot:TRINITY_DN33206_c0_g1_i1.p2 TRINITY_DN33206_c0_g1~~TRINITY_DN33206_c0_g1_i1.p2  ORF type:complete len:126 (+),score=4.91 TRINITY_DN33206_c0_g1_i1:35-379(+)
MVLERLNKVVFTYSPLAKNVGQIKLLIQQLCGAKMQARNPKCVLQVKLEEKGNCQVDITFTNNVQQSFDMSSMTCRSFLDQISERCQQLTNLETLEKAKFDYKNIKIHSTFGFT